MSIKINADDNYRGLDIYKQVNKNNKEQIEHYIKQIEPRSALRGFVVLEMLRDLEEALNLELN